MARFTNVDRHSLYPVEHWGDTLVVSPRGDAAGFNPKTVNHEMATVTELAQSPDVKHLIVDFAGANYFGSIVLGGLVQLSQTVKNRGGRVAICNASQDMQDILRIMKLDNLWELYPDRRVALRRIAKIPLKQQLWSLRKPAAIAAVVLLLVVAYVLYPRPNYGRIYYEQVHELWREYHDRQALAGEEEWRLFSERSTKKMKPMIDHIDRRTKAGRAETGSVEFSVMYVMRDYWPKMLQRNTTEAKEATASAEVFLNYAKAELEGRPVPSHVFSSALTPEKAAAMSPSMSMPDSTEGAAATTQP